MACARWWPPSSDTHRTLTSAVSYQAEYWNKCPRGSCQDRLDVTVFPQPSIFGVSRISGARRRTLHVTLHVRVHDSGENPDLKFTKIMHLSPELRGFHENGGY